MPIEKNEIKPRLEPPTFVDGRPLLIAGLRQRYTAGTRGEIPALWKRFGASIDDVPVQVSQVAYGICLQLLSDTTESFDYVAGVEVRDASGLPDGWTSLRIPALHYAVFPHREHVSRLAETIDAMFGGWLPGSGFVAHPGAGDTPGLVERYGEAFDPRSGTGDVQVWIPIDARA